MSQVPGAAPLLVTKALLTAVFVVVSDGLRGNVPKMRGVWAISVGCCRGHGCMWADVAMDGYQCSGQPVPGLQPGSASSYFSDACCYVWTGMTCRQSSQPVLSCCSCGYDEGSMLSCYLAKPSFRVLVTSV